MTLRRTLLAVALTFAAAASIAACGGNDSEESDGGERARIEVVQSANSDDFDPAAIYERYSNGVVTVTSLFGNASLDQLLEGNGQAGQGSGFVLDDRGHVATNAHVITEGQGRRINKAREVFVQFADGNQVEAKVVGFDPNADVGLIKVDPGGLDLVPLRLARGDSVQVGEPVAAIGSPFGEQQSLSIGVVSATNRTINALTNFQISDAIQTDAAVNRGNSGGPLLDANGAVIGINSQIRSSSGGSVGVGFAVSVDTVRRSLEQLRANGEARYAFIGISSQALYPQLAERLDLPVEEGALVAEVVEDGPADKAGIRGGGREIRFQTTPVRPGGDVITKVDDHEVSRDQDLAELIGRYQPGDTVTLEVYRDGDRRTVRVQLAERPDDLPG